jgi:carbon monoxide dehydrogenase subunit G
MPTQEFRREMVIDASRPRVWEILLDVETVAGWVGLIGQVTEITPLSRYQAVLQDRVGPFRLRADLAIRVPHLVEGSTVVLEAEGEDRQVRSRIKLDLTLNLVDAEAGATVLLIEGRYEVTGRVATLGASLIRHKADTILDQFCAKAAKAA